MRSNLSMLLSSRFSAPSIVVSAVAATVAASAMAAPQAEAHRFIVGETASLMGDCGATIAQQAADAQELSVAMAVARAAEILGATSEYASILANGLEYLCHHEGMTSCDAAAESHAMAADFALAAQMLSAGDLKSAAMALRDAKGRYDEVFSFGRAATLPDGQRESFAAASASLGATADMLDTLADPTAFVEYLKPGLEASESGAASMLATIRSVEPIEWPAGFVGAEIVGFPTNGADFSEGSAHAAALAGADVQALLASWRQIGAEGVLERLGGEILLSRLEDFGSNLRDGMYGLRADIAVGSEVPFDCELKCQNDNDCSVCHIVRAGLSSKEENPTQWWWNSAIIDTAVEIDPQQRANRIDREAIIEAFSKLAQKFPGFYTELWIEMESQKCSNTLCWLIDRESECVTDETKWIHVPLSLSASQHQPEKWTTADWAEVAKNSEKAARDWCQNQ